jgi:two-component system, cell cycle response regulator DivK
MNSRLDRPRNKAALRSTRESVSYCLSAVVKICRRVNEREILLSTRIGVLRHFTLSKMTVWLRSLMRYGYHSGFPSAGTPCAQLECVAKSAKKILLVEDNEEVRELLALFMTRLGYKVFEVATGLEAIDRASTVRPDLIMMDIRLPGINGAEATARLKANPSTRNIPVLIITGYAAGIDTRLALDEGAAEILHKPIDVTILSNVLRRYLSSRPTKRPSPRKK